MPQTPGIGFWKLFGSGSGEGFTPIPNTAVYAILATWPDRETAEAQTGKAPVFARYLAKATESWTVFLQASSVRGDWSDSHPFEISASPATGPLAALTRASIKPSIALKFWRRVPAISAVIGDDPNVAFKIGVGEVPWFHQVTFSIWPDAQSMANFAHKDGPHARAIKAVRAENWFSEELYARFAILGGRGSWEGRDPLSRLDKRKVAI